ncbi:MAG: ABC transporter ATP-binding protein [Actinobacteria bacterium]|nr:ABC transporter ATP-binding protein [Actinomycetota bacterium]
MLSVDEITVAYGPVTALHGVSLQVSEGEIVAVLGPNGAGKTTLLRTLAGALRPRHGQIWLDGKRLDGIVPEEAVRRGIATVPEGRLVFPGLTVEENLQLGAISRRDRQAIRAEIDELFSMFPILGERRAQPAGTLSGGEQQQLSIGRALMARPRVMLLDEPSLGLAPIIVGQIFALLRDLRGRGATLLLVEQNVHKALEIADRAYVLSVGRVVTSGPARTLATGELERMYLGMSRAR